MNLREQDRARLRAEWLRLFDRSKLDNLLLACLSKGMAPGEQIGQGSHFTAYRLSGHLSGLALNVARPEFFKRPRFKSSDWAKAVRSASRLKLPLIGPMEVLELEIEGKPGIGLVQLMGDGAKDSASVHWGPIEPNIEETITGLALAGLKINDVLQIRCRSGVPFIVDYSDLTLSSR